MSQETQQQPQQEPQQAPAPSSPVPPSSANEQAVRAAREAQIAEMDRQRIAAARAKLAADLREARAVPEPAPADAPVARQDAPQAAQPAAPAQPSPAVADALIATIQAQMAVAEEAKANAARAGAEAAAKLAAAEAKERELAKAALNPVEFLEKTGISLDEWQARLLNGGDETLEQRRVRETLETAKKAEQRVLQLEAQLQQQAQLAKRQDAVSKLAPALDTDFPVVSALLGAEGALDQLVQASRAQGKQIDAKAFFAGLEETLIKQQKSLLSNNKIQAKLGLSVKSPQSEVVAQSPKTLDNRTTSTVSSSPRQGPMSERERIARGRALIKQMYSQTK